MSASCVAHSHAGQLTAIETVRRDRLAGVKAKNDEELRGIKTEVKAEEGKVRARAYPIWSLRLRLSAARAARRFAAHPRLLR